MKNKLEVYIESLKLAATLIGKEASESQAAKVKLFTELGFTTKIDWQAFNDIFAEAQARANAFGGKPMPSELATEKFVA